MKVSSLTFLIVGISLGIVALSVGLFGLFGTVTGYLTNKTEQAKFEAYTKQLEAEAAKMPEAQKRVKAALARRDTLAATWQQVVSMRTPPKGVANGGIDLAVNRWQLTVDAQKFRDSVQRAVNRQVKRGGVKVIAGPEVPPAPTTATNVVESYFNYPAIKFPVAIFDFGTITVQGNLEQIFENVTSWSRMPNYLAVADGLSITGTSPNLTATYALSVVAYIRADQIAPPVPETAAAGGARGGGGGARVGGPAAAGGGPAAAGARGASVAAG